MKIKNYCMAFAVVLASLTACNKTDDAVNTDELTDKDLYIKIEQPTSKADTDPVTGGTVSFSEGALYFTDDAGNILLYKRITNNPVAGTLTAQQLQAGTTIEKVPGKATQVHVYGNFETDKNYTSLSQIDPINYSTQKDPDFGVSKAGLYGGAPLVVTSSTTAEATINVTAILARLEVDKLIANDQEIASYTLAGIYINNYYMKVLPDGNAIPANHPSNPTDISSINHLQEYWKYYRESENGEYPDDMEGYLFDDGVLDGVGTLKNIAESTNGVVQANKTWAYNVFAVGSTTPHIVFHFTDMEMVEQTGKGTTGYARPNATTGNDGEAYLTITGYTAQANLPGGFVNIEGGNVYKMAEVNFNDGDLGEVPEKNEKKDVLVTIKLMEWKVVPVNPSFD